MSDARFPILDVRFGRLDYDDQLGVISEYRRLRGKGFSRFDARYFTNADIDRKAGYR